uniref:Pollen Ole e 1 allergen and extensin family protein n=1 Tax=Kalanchoe fedtschenkoi TaxID=63787 RepID=A0A7N0UFY1_KALFE
MASNGCLEIKLLSLLILALTLPTALAYVETTVDVVVEGMVYCQTCEAYGSWSLKDAKPIGGATVGVVCLDHKSRVKYYKAFDTNSDGYFYGQLEGFTMDHYLLDHPLHSCKLRLVSSPLDNCNILSNVNNGLNGSPLRYENKVVRGEKYEAVIYSAGPLAFRPETC